MDTEEELQDRSSTLVANTLWGALTAEILQRLGLCFAVVSPGSRSTPLALAFALSSNVESIPVLDERSAGFFALGLAKSRHRPVALVCTSGTAAANFFPALVEAKESAVPLIVLTADRPPELRFCQSGQTIDQQKLYGQYAQFYAELSLPSCKPARLRYLRQSLIHAWERALYPAKGPVHLNFPFREPLALFPGMEPPALKSHFRISELLSHVEPLPEMEPSLTEVRTRPFSSEMLKQRNGLIIAGPVSPEDSENYVQALALISKRLGWPILADGLNPLRSQAKGNPYLICHYDIILRNPEVAGSLEPDAVLSIGPLPVSKVLRKWLEKREVKTWVLDPRPDNMDPLHRPAIPLHLSVEALSLLLEGKEKAKGKFCRRWLSAERKAARSLRQCLDQCHSLFEGRVAYLLSRYLPGNTPVFIANSMPVRDVEAFWQPGNRLSRLYFNRGANGIDGSLSTALGVAHRNRSSVLLAGDLALLHDTNGFLAARKLMGHLSIVLINNKGGGIFESLPVSSFGSLFEDYFATPQAVSFSVLAQAYGVDYHCLASLDELPPMIKKLPSHGVRLIEIPTDRKKDMLWRRQTFQSIADKIKAPA